MPQNFRIFNKIKISTMFPTVRPVLCVYSSKVTILRGKLLIISFLFVQTLRRLNYNYNLKYRGLNAHFSTCPPKFRPPKPRTKSPPMTVAIKINSHTPGRNKALLVV